MEKKLETAVQGLGFGVLSPLSRYHMVYIFAVYTGMMEKNFETTIV